MSAASAPSALAAKGDVSVEAGSLSYQADTGAYRLGDGVVLRRGLVTLRLGDRPFGRGELVEIEGAVGVRVLSVEVAP